MANAPKVPNLYDMIAAADGYGDPNIQAIDVDYFAERAAIIEFDGGYDRGAADRKAYIEWMVWRNRNIAIVD